MSDIETSLELVSDWGKHNLVQFNPGKKSARFPLRKGGASFAELSPYLRKKHRNPRGRNIERIPVWRSFGGKSQNGFKKTWGVQ